MQECRNAGMQECRNAGMQNAGMQECRNAGMQECRKPIEPTFLLAFYLAGDGSVGSLHARVGNC